LKITVESTREIVTVNGVPARVWHGTAESGAPVIIFVTRIGVEESARPEQQAEFERELESASTPRLASLGPIPLRLVL